MDTLHRLGCEIKRLRLEKKLSHKELGDMVGYDKSRILRIETGRINSSINSLEKVLDALGVQLEIVEKDVPLSNCRSKQG